MKKFMKAIAFITVMCLLLSTVAFAANDDVEVKDFATREVKITVKDVQKGEQVAIFITRGDAADYTFNTDTILYVEQKVAESTSTVFEAEVTDTSVNTIDVYAGYPSNSSAYGIKVGNDIAITEKTELTLVAAQVIDDITTQPNYDEETMAKVNEGTKGSVVWLKLNATNIAAGDLSKMYWAFHVTDAEGNTDTKYSIGDVAALGLGTVLSGDVEIAAAFESTGYTVTGANAIFLLKGEDVHTAEGDLLEEIKGDKVEK